MYHHVQTGRISLRAKALVTASTLTIGLVFGSSVSFADGTLTVNGGAPTPFNNVTDPYVFTGNIPANKVIVVTSDQNSTITSNTEFDFLVAPGFVNTVTVNPGVTQTSPSYGIWVRSNLGATTLNVAGTVDAALQGILAGASTGGILVDGKSTGAVSGGTNGMELYNPLYAVPAGSVTVQNFAGDISGAAGNGIYILTTVAGAGVDPTMSFAGIQVKDNGNIKGATSGIYVYDTNGTNPLNITGNGDITGGTTPGIWTTTLTGKTTISGNGNILSTLDEGITATAFGGDIDINNNGNITGLTAGVLATTTLAGKINVSDNDDITGGSLPAIWTIAATGPTSINGNKNITSTADEGITSTSIGGAIGIGDIAFNGEIKGATYGIYADSTVGAGPVTIKVNKNVTGTGFDGILAASTGGTGTILIDVLDPAIVSGKLHGVTMSTNGTSTLNNAGTIKQIGDTGLAGVGGGNAIYSPFGTNVVNNKSGGDIIGTIFTGGTAFTLNNEAGGVWTPGSDAANILNAFILNDKVNNAGLINVRQGDTTLTNLGMLNNMAGGVIDMTYAGTSPSADEDLKTVGYTAGAGSTVKFNVDFTKSHSLNDSSTGNGGNGRGDTIIVTGKATPVATSTLDVSAIGAPAIGSSGSIALIDTIASPLSDPGLSGLSTILGNISTNYVLANPLTTGAVRVEIVESALGGAYLQWAPNITAESLGGFFGGTLGDAASGGSQAAAASGGAGGGLGPNGGPSGGGAAGEVADLAASNASGQSGIAGASGGAQCGDGSRMTAWASGDGAGTRFDGGGKGSNINGAFGIERDISEDACGQIALGAFGTVGVSKTSWASGSSDSDSWGAGAYARVGSLSGFYATALGAVNWSEADLTNNVFLSTATQKSTGYLGNVNVGHTSNLTDATTLDLRAFASFAHVNGGGFTDSRGITVDGSESDTTVLGALVGLETDFTDSLSGFSRAGIRHVWIEQSSTAFGTTVSGKSDTTYASAEAGVRARLADNASLTLSGNGDFSKYSKAWGLNMGLAIRF